MASKPRYTGILAEPIDHRKIAGSLGLLADSSDNQFKEKYKMELVDRLAALFAHYGIPPKDEFAMAKLALALASAHVPGFKDITYGTKRPGRPRKWDFVRLTELYADVQSLVRDGKNEHQACRVLATSGRYAKRYRGCKHKTLHRRYLESKKFNPSTFALFGHRPPSLFGSGPAISDPILRVIEQHALYADKNQRNSA